MTAPDCDYYASGTCGNRRGPDDCTGTDCGLYTRTILDSKEAKCQDCLDPRTLEGWMHTTQAEDVRSLLGNSYCPPLPEPESLSFVKPSEQAYALGCSLEEAKQIITGERQDSYGSPEDSFTIIAKYWSSYLDPKQLGGPVITAKDVAHMMMLFKIARCSGQKPSRDNYIDIQGYAAIAADRLTKEG